ncbi:subtilisin-like protease SBT4.10 [Impatiens glandulifera]|uniref:subtilisin-like protease SBT4.10 n=1 Tax=Impatiens glandulifera TaxID=253017 RepID=UPI001FB0D283|nr:subtilisin-like protease SBT4.10 [Impatiens glandulifera]
MIKKSAFKIWNFLKEEYEGNEKIKGMQVINLIREFEMVKMKDSETIKEYSNRLLTIVNKVLAIITERFEATISTLKNTKDITKASRKDITKVNLQQRNVAKPADHEEELFVETCFAENDSSNNWLVDSVCTNHVIFDRGLFKELDTSFNFEVKTDNGEYITVKGKGIMTDVEEERKVYIVYMGSLPEGEYAARSHHINLLQAIGHTDKRAENIIIRSYTRSFNGFAAKLTPQEASKLKRMTLVVSIFQSQKLQILTTRSWDYMGFSLEIPRNPKIESDIIIGHIDTGILPDMESLSDHGLSDVPLKWKGVCIGGKNFTCNKKLIGARYYSGDSIVDTLNHGTHTASTAVGRVVRNANFFGIANGTARGGVPSSRIATYKVCNDRGCDGKDVLAAFDDAIADNVDIINLSLGNSFPVTFNEDANVIGSFHAMEKGILTVQAAGNSGNTGLFTVSSVAPWVFTIASSTTDRKIINKLILGNERTFIVSSTAVNPFSTGSDNKMLVYGRGITNHCNESSAMQCMEDCIDPSLVKGKIMLCDVDSSMSRVVLFAKNSSASGVILRKGQINKDDSELAVHPAAFLKDSDYNYVKSYLNSTTFAYARILKSETIRYDAPIVASDSSRGPNVIFPGIFKPDITAPGVNILAESPTLENFGSLGAKYNIESGTSMACPHVTGAAAYVKSKHPNWSISAIKSSLMTTAWSMSTKYNTDAELGYGSGHVDPVKAEHPGLVYETFIDEYITMFCSLGSDGEKFLKILGKRRKCTKENTISPKDVNYPAMTASVNNNSHFTIQFVRVVTNVGLANSTYHAHINTGDNTIHVTVEPSIISFVNLNERKKFVVTISGQWLNQNYISSSLVWFDDKDTDPCFLLLQDMLVFPQRKTNLDVDLRSYRYPAKSASAYPYKTNFASFSYSRPISSELDKSDFPQEHDKDEDLVDMFFCLD